MFAMLENKIKQLEEEETLSLWKHDSQTIEKAKAKGLKWYVKQDLLHAVLLLSTGGIQQYQSAGVIADQLCADVGEI